MYTLHVQQYQYSAAFVALPVTALE